MIHPHGVAAFFADHYGQQYLLLQRDQPGYYDTVLDEAALDRFLALQDLNPARLALVKDGVLVPTDRWTRIKESLPGPFKTVISTDRIFQCFHEGATIVANNAELTIPTLTLACQAFEQETRHKVQANIYLTPPSAQGFGRHYDAHDIFVMQVRGAKHWRLFDTGEQFPLGFEGFTAEAEPVAEFTLRPGDLLYLPRGVTHEAVASDEATIHVNFAIERRTGVDLIESLATLARDDLFFRRPVPHPLAGDSARSAYVTEFAGQLQTLVERHSADRLLAERERAFAERRLGDMNGRLGTALNLAALTVDSLVRRQAGAPGSWETGADGATIHIAGQRLTIPSFVDPAPFFAEGAFRIGAINGMITNQGRIDLVRLLARAGYLQIVAV